MSEKNTGIRLLGFAFASADVLFEVDAAGEVRFAVGASSRVLGVRETDLIGRPWEALIHPCDQGVVAALFDSLSGGGRRGPVRARLQDVPGRPVRHANIYACRLPQLQGSISCALSLGREGFSGADEASLLDRDAFEEVIGKLLQDAKEAGLDVELALVEVAGLTQALSAMSKGDQDKTVGGLKDVLRAESLRGAATRLEDEKFAVVREKPGGPDTLADRLKRAALRAGVAVNAEAAILSLEEAGSAQGLRALRFTLDRFLQDGLAGDADVGTTFREGLDGTLRQAKAFTDRVTGRSFKLAYQPIVELKTRTVHHYEALARFPQGDETFATIRMAEELDIIEAFDLAVVEMAAGALKGFPADVRVAVNVSGRSFLRPRFLDRLLDIATKDARQKGRLLFEITESSALANLDLADERIQRLRREGFKVCIDDFGSGSASLSYLQSLTVDAVKIDGQFVKKIASGGRDAVFVRHLVAMCRELKVFTIAEMVETESVAETIKSFGVDLGQGFLFGAPLPQILAPAAVRPAARRMGSVETWG